MIQESPASQWQDIGWNGLFFQLPASWQPTVIYPSYLFFEQAGMPALEIKWQQIRGEFSSSKNFAQRQGALKNGAQLYPWEIPPDLHSLLTSYEVAAFQLQNENSRSHGLLLYCPQCKQATLVQWYFEPESNKNILKQIFASFRDHPEGDEQTWSVFDIRTLLPANAALQAHEFLPGRYTLSFGLDGTAVTLYRFKPAVILLQNKQLGQFGTALLNREPLEEGNGWASWHHRAKGLELLLAKARRNPAWQWMRLWHEPEHNVIHGVKAEGKNVTDTGWLERICDNYVSIESQ
jgi:hypothetical protein